MSGAAFVHFVAWWVDFAVGDAAPPDSFGIGRISARRKICDCIGRSARGRAIIDRLGDDRTQPERYTHGGWSNQSTAGFPTSHYV